MNDQFENFLKTNKPKLTSDDTRALKATLLQKINRSSSLKKLWPITATALTLLIVVTINLNNQKQYSSELSTYLAEQMDYDYYTADLEEDYYGKLFLSSL